jgi:FkbM family methyltransferase
MIEVIHEHSVDLSLLPVNANILDLGCRGFLFTDYLIKKCHNVYPVDCDLLQGASYYQAAITNYDGFTDLYKSNDPQGTRINRRYEAQSETSVICCTLVGFSLRVGIEFWDLIKMDIEGSEYEVIMSLTEPPATQLSIEFHLHTGIYGDKEMKEMEDKLLSFGYFPTKHDKTNEHGSGFNYWDSLFVLQSHRKEYSHPTNY